MTKIFLVSVKVSDERQTYIEAETATEAVIKAERLYENDRIEYEWGGDETSHDMEAIEECTPAMLQADYRGDPRKIAATNASNLKEITQ